MKQRAFAGAAKQRLALLAQMHAIFLVALAKELSDGDLWGRQVPTAQQLADAGYPYSTRKPKDSAQNPDYVINVQTGKFRAAWKGEVTTMGDDWVIVVWNDCDYAKFMNGTQKMRRRPILDEVNARSAARLQEILSAAFLENARIYNAGSPVAPTGGNGLLFAIYIGASSGINTLRQAV